MIVLRYIDHYWSKSTEEFVNKINRGDVIKGHRDNKYNKDRIEIYFTYNKITEAKINYIENKTRYNLSRYRAKIKISSH